MIHLQNVKIFPFLGHFDNFSCWQFGEETSAHKEGIKTMIEEIQFLSKDDLHKGHIQVRRNNRIIIIEYK